MGNRETSKDERESCRARVRRTSREVRAAEKLKLERVADIFCYTSQPVVSYYHTLAETFNRPMATKEIVWF